MTKKIVVLCCFMLSPVLQNVRLETVPNFPRPFNSIRFVFEDRAYGLSASSKAKSTVPIAPNIHIGHEISLFVTTEVLQWHVSGPSTENIVTVNNTQVAPGLFFRYAYQIPLTQNFGFFLGSTIGITVPFSEKASFNTGYGFFFPTILFGMTGTPTTNDRLSVGVEYSASWYPQMYLVTNQGDKKMLSPALDAWNFFLNNDYFISNNLAVSFGGGVRLINNACGLQFVCTQSNFLNRITLNNITYYGQLGVIFSDIR